MIENNFNADQRERTRRFEQSVKVKPLKKWK